MATIPELLDGHVTLEVECLDRLYLNVHAGAVGQTSSVARRTGTTFGIDDENFGPLFIKVCSYAPWRIKLCLKGHQWAKRQLNKRGIQYEALDNGSLSCSAPQKLQEVCDELGPEDVERVSGNGSVAFPCRSGRKTGARATTGIGRSSRWK
jgi:hypothetical protein